MKGLKFAASSRLTLRTGLFSVMLSMTLNSTQASELQTSQSVPSEPLVLDASALTDTRMVMYPGQAWLEQRYSVDLSKGDYRLQLSPVSDLLLFETLQIGSDNGVVDKVQLQRQSLDSDTFYRGLVGQTVMLYQNGDMQAPHRRARLSVWRNGIGIATLESGEQLVIDLNDKNGLRISSTGEHYDTRSFEPRLSARISQQGDSNALQIGYFSHGIGYRIYYQLQIDHQSRQLSGRAVSILSNQTNTDYTSVDLTLASGDTGVSRSPRFKRGLAAADASMAMEVSQGPESLGELRFYPVQQAVDLPAYSEQQFTLLDFNNLKFQDHYQLDLSGTRAPRSAEHPRRIYRFKSNQNLPAGEIRLFEADAKGQMQWILVSNMAASGEGQMVTLQAAIASDIQIQREALQQQRLDRNLLQVDWRVRMYNSKTEPVWIELHHRDHNLLKIVAASGVEQPVANVLRLELPPGESEQSYSAQYRQ